MAKQSILPVFVPHAGCPCQCVFCNQRAIAGDCQPDAGEKIEDGLLRLECSGAQTVPPQVAFYGGSFTAIPADKQIRLLETAQRFIQAGRVSSVRISTRPDAIDDTILTRLRQYHVTVIELGAQSMCNEVLKAARRGHTAQDTEDAAKLIQKYGFQLILQTMVGLPGDTPQTVRETACRVSGLSPDGVRIYPVAVLPQTELFEMYQRGEYRPLTVEDATALCADMLEVFQEHEIPVIRLGLNPTEELGEQIVAGAYHPALGELVYGEVYYRRMDAALKPYKGHRGMACFSVPRADLSKAIGQKRRNIARLMVSYPGVKVTVVPSDVQGFAFTEIDF